MSFIRYFDDKIHSVKIIDKQSSKFMKLLGWFLDLASHLRLAGITSEDFLENYTTTISNKIYSSEINQWDPPNELIVHELTHVLLWNWLYAFLYLVSPKMRAYYESVCVQTEMLIFRTEMTDEDIERHSQFLTKYGVKKDYALKMLSDRRNEVLKREPHPASNKVFRAWRSWRVLEHDRRR